MRQEAVDREVRHVLDVVETEDRLFQFARRLEVQDLSQIVVRRIDVRKKGQPRELLQCRQCVVRQVYPLEICELPNGGDVRDPLPLPQSAATLLRTTQH